MASHSQACRTLGLAEDTLGLTEDTLGQLPILEKALGCKAVMDGDSEEDIKAEQDKCHRLRDRNLSAKNLQKINMLYDSARMRNINVKSVTDNIFTAKDTEEYIELTGKQWKEFLNQKRPNPRYTGFSNSSDDNKRLAEPWSVIWVLRAEPMRRKGGPTETESVVSMAEGDVIIKKYMFIVVDRHHAGCTALRITTKDGQGMDGLDRNEKDEYEYVYNDSYTGKKKNAKEKKKSGIELDGEEKFWVDPTSMVHLVPTDIPFQTPCCSTGLRVSRPRQRKSILESLGFQATPERLASPNMRNNVYKGQPMVKNISVFPVALPDIDVLKNESATPAALGEQYKADMQRLDVPQHSLGHYIPGFDTASSGVERLDESDAKSGVQSNASPPKSTRAPVTSHSPSPAHKTLSAPSFPGPAPVPAPGVLDQTQSDGQNNLKRKFATSKTDYQPSKKFKTGQTNAVSDPASSAVGGAPNTPLAKGDTGITGQLNGLQTNATAGASKPSRWDQKPAYTAHSHSCNH